MRYSHGLIAQRSKVKHEVKEFRFPGSVWACRKHGTETKYDYWDNDAVTWLFTATDGRVTARLYDQFERVVDPFSPTSLTPAHAPAFTGELDATKCLGTWDFGPIEHIDTFLEGYTDTDGKPIVPNLSAHAEYSDAEPPESGTDYRRPYLIDMSTADSSIAIRLRSFLWLDMPFIAEGLGHPAYQGHTARARASAESLRALYAQEKHLTHEEQLTASIDRLCGR